jgi:flagellar basal-body rod modification protein FlgD
MSAIDSNTNNSLNNILDKLGIRSSENNKTKKNDTLGQEDFLKLMTTQLQNQDPFSPMENGDFIAQMAQFSTVTGITEMSESLKSLSGQLGEFRIATAASMLGNSVLVPGDIARPDSNGEIHGVIDMPVASTATNISFSNASGEILHNIDLGAQSSGLVGFEWTDIPPEILEANKTLTVKAYINGAEGLEEISPSVFAEVMAASTGTDSTGVVLSVKDYGNINASEVPTFRSNKTRIDTYKN